MRFNVLLIIGAVALFTVGCSSSSEDGAGMSDDATDTVQMKIDKAAAERDRMETLKLEKSQREAQDSIERFNRNAEKVNRQAEALEKQLEKFR